MEGVGSIYPIMWYFLIRNWELKALIRHEWRGPSCASNGLQCLKRFHDRSPVRGEPGKPVWEEEQNSSVFTDYHAELGT